MSAFLCYSLELGVPCSGEEMKVLFIIFAAVLCSDLFLCQENATQCVLISLPKDSSEGKRGISIPLDTTLDLIEVDSTELIVSFVGNVFKQGSQNGSEGVCSGKVIGVVGDLDSKTARIIHTLTSRSNLSIRLVASLAPSSFVPVTNLKFPNILDMNPLDHYIEALINLVIRQNWTRIGVVSDNTLYYQFAAEVLQKQLVSDYQNNSTKVGTWTFFLPSESVRCMLSFQQASPLFTVRRW